MVFPDQTNHYGTLFGGHALQLMDQVAFISASRYCRATVVTACSEKVDFHTPVHAGQIAELVARVIATGRTSMTVEVKLFAEWLRSGERKLCTKGRFVLVAVNDKGRPIAVPALRKGRVRSKGR
jgi:acyl-CoA hydrolase